MRNLHGLYEKSLFSRRPINRNSNCCVSQYLVSLKYQFLSEASLFLSKCPFCAADCQFPNEAKYSH